MQRCVGKSCKAIICNKVKQLQKVEMEQYHRKRRKSKKLQQEGIFARSPLTFVCLIFFVRMSFEFIIINATERARNHVFSQNTKVHCHCFWLESKEMLVEWMLPMFCPVKVKPTRAHYCCTHPPHWQNQLRVDLSSPELGSCQITYPGIL